MGVGSSRCYIATYRGLRSKRISGLCIVFFLGRVEDQMQEPLENDVNPKPLNSGLAFRVHCVQGLV